MEFKKKNINIEKLQEVLDSFAVITGIKAAFFDNSQHEVKSKNMDHCAFCKSVRDIPLLIRRCWTSDDYGLKIAIETKKTYLYRCHLGLWEAVVPLYINENLLGFLMIGQVKSEDYLINWDSFEKELISINVNQDTINLMRNQYDQLVEYNIEQIQAAAKMLEIISEHIISSDIFTIYEADIIEKTKQLILENYTKEISVKQISAILNISSSTLITLFKKQMGITVNEYIEQLRINKAKELLLLSDLSIKEITFECGYNDQNYFSRVFKKNTSMCPSEFVNKNKI